MYSDILFHREKILKARPFSLFTIERKPCIFFWGGGLPQNSCIKKIITEGIYLRVSIKPKHFFRTSTKRMFENVDQQIKQKRTFYIIKTC